MIIACIQPKIHQSINRCYSEIEQILKILTDKVANIDIICLPERWVPLLNDISQNIQKERGENYSFIKNLAGEYHINIISGAIWEKRENSRKPRITSYFINEKGEEVGRQHKIHLYSYEQGQFEPGKELNLFSFNEYFFAILICF
ncbi:MAG: carbon-nitrogen hydrolase family protein, partial [Promethearchaeota archaeon]